jgi:hypothetical protein
MIEGTLAEVTVNSSTSNRRKDVGQPRHGRASSWYLAIASGCAGPRHLVSSTRETAQFEATELQRGGPSSAFGELPPHNTALLSL